MPYPQTRQWAVPAIPIWLDFQRNRSTSPEMMAAGTKSAPAPVTAEASTVNAVVYDHSLFDAVNYTNILRTHGAFPIYRGLSILDCAWGA